MLMMNTLQTYCKSPLNYIGGKYKLLPQIESLFPQNINKFVDLFCGGCDVTANIKANEIYANDINYFLINMFKTFQKMNIEQLLHEIDMIIDEYSLSKTNKNGYLALRNHYNKSVNKNSIELYVLICHSFNYQIRFNSNYEYNNAFGNNRSYFSNNMRNNLIKFHEAIKNVYFTSQSFEDFDFSHLCLDDFVYADPPYLITTGSYNDGKRGFKGWSKSDDIMLFDLLDNLNNNHIKFAMSNVLKHKGFENSELIRWASKYKIHYLDFNYRNSNYHGKNLDKDTVEVLITNF